MTEYIRKQDAFDAVEARIAELMTHPEFRRKHLDIDLSGVIRNISAIKPAYVAPVVRCRDCKHWQRGMVGMGCYWDADYPHEENDFCSRGERREE